LGVHLAPILALVLLLCGPPCFADGEREAPFFDIDIPSLNAADALNRLATQTGATLLFPYDLAKVRQANAVSGRYTLQEALAILLRGSGLSGGLSDNGVIRISLDGETGRGQGGKAMTSIEREQSTGRPSLLAGIAAFVASIVTAPIAVGQEGAAGGQGAGQGASVLEEIVVTSKRRASLLQEVSEQITVFSAEDIEDAQIHTYQDFADLTPNLQTFENFRRGVFNISLRGIPTVQGGEPPVTVLVDGAQVSGLDFVNQDLMDVESIQILRGPQGAVYGRGAIGGAILINTRQPTNEYEGQLLGTWTDEIDAYRIGGSVAGPIVKDRLFFRVAGTYEDRDGFIDNSLAGGQCDFIDEYAIRGQLRFQPIENLTIDGKVSYLDGRNYATCMNFATDADPFLDNGDDFADDLPRDFKQFDDREIEEYTFRINWETAIGTFESVTSFQDSDSFSPGDADFGPAIQPVFFENPVIVDSVNTDFHFISKESDTFTWIAGFFYQDRETNNLLRVGFSPLPIQPPFFVNSDQLDLSEAWAVYGEGTYRFSERLELSVALRYDEDKRESEDRNTPGSFIEEKFTSVQPRGSISYFWNEDFMTYFSVGRGFRSGGFNSLADTLAVGLTDRLFEKETATNYELGFKSTFFNRRLTVNGAAFRTDFDNQQFFFVDVMNVARIVLTFPETRIYGGELEIAAIPMEGLDVRASLGVADGTIEDGGSFEDTNSPHAHKYTANIIVQKVFPVTGALNGRARVEYERRGPIYYDQFDQFRFPATDFVNLFLGIEHEHWSAGVFGRNVTDERIPTFYGPDSFGDGFHGFFQNLPARWGVELRAQF
jgi:iron complex outermembrane receptor protein